MNIKQAFLLAIKSLLSSKMRSFLTMLGIIIGIAAVIILVSLMNGLSKSILDSFEDMGTNLISVEVMGRGSNRSVTFTEMQALMAENPELISGVSPNVSVGVKVKKDTESLTANCIGINEDYYDIKNVKMASGRFINYLDVARRQKVCILGAYEVTKLFGGIDPLGEEVKINGDSYTVIGTLTEKADAEEGSADDTVIIPYTLATRLSGNGTISSYYISASSKDTVNQASALVKAKLYQAFQSEDYYMVMSSGEIIEEINEMMGIMGTVLIGIAGISLLVGGIGIMNIMLVSVSERVREIGIRKSLGGRRKDILGQFIIEAATTSIIGGIIGIILGVILSYGAGKLIDLTAVPSVTAIIVAVSVSAAIGIVFGYLPASKAAKMHPIEALREN
ncbi:MAG: ABC transporter permease [Clostridia bacterium]|nr:ABC transporter permease [Clostridia bacterium]MDD4571994.1 ABC transporter permease [Clostridia bacterium]